LAPEKEKKKKRKKEKNASVTFIHDFWGNKWPKLTRFGGKKNKNPKSQDLDNRF
jgi:hypothetical protein